MGATLVGIVGLAVWVVYDVGNMSYEKNVASLERELDRRSSIPQIQAWLASRGAQGITASIEHDPKQWPPCIRDLRTVRIRQAEGGGVWLHLVAGVDLAVYPRGTRPPRQTHKPSMATPGYLGTYGKDAYISMVER